MNIYLLNDKQEDQTLCFAAEELASYLRKMLPKSQIRLTTLCPFKDSETFSIQLRTDKVHSSSDSFEISVSHFGGFISGSNSYSVLAGVYHYLYLLGCRFLGPDCRCEVVPRITDSSILCRHISHTASYKHRGICLEGADSVENIIDVINWLPKVGYNTFFLQFQIPYTFLARWYHHENNPLEKAEPFTLEDAVSLTAQITEEIKKRGLTLHQVGHGWTGACLGVPSTDWKKAELELSETQQSMLAELNGRRELFHGIPMNSNLCYSCPDVIQEFATHVADYANMHSEIDYLHVWLADEFNNVCECDNCRKALLSDQYIAILNKIDQMLCERKLNTKIVFLLYQELLWPPKNARFLHPERFVLMFAPISRTFEKSYQINDTLPPIPEYHRNQITLPVNLDENLAFLRAWQELFTGDSFVYDYPLGRAHYGDFGYQHIAHVIADDISQLDKLQLNGYISCQELRNGMPNFLPNYVMGRKLFDVSSSFESLRDEYMRAAYGNNVNEVTAYLQKLSELCSCDYFNGKGDRINPTMAQRMRDAEQLSLTFSTSDFLHPASDNSKSERNIFLRLLAYHCRIFPLLEKSLKLLAEGDVEGARQKREEFCELICAEEPKFQPFLDVYRITEVSEKYTGL